MLTFILRQRKNTAPKEKKEKQHSSSFDSAPLALTVAGQRHAIYEPGIILPMAFSGFLEARDIAKFRQLCKTANRDVGETALKGVLAVSITDINVQIPRIQKRINDIINALTDDLPFKLAMQGYMQDLATHHPALMSQINLAVEHKREQNRKKANFIPALAVVALVLALLGLYSSILNGRPSALLAPLVFSIGISMAEMKHLNATSQDLKLLEELRTKVNTYVFNNAKLTRLMQLMPTRDAAIVPGSGRSLR